MGGAGACAKVDVPGCSPAKMQTEATKAVFITRHHEAGEIPERGLEVKNKELRTMKNGQCARQHRKETED